MVFIGLYLRVGILWFLVMQFTGSANSAQSLRKTCIVVLGMMIVSFLTPWLLGGIIGTFTAIIDIAILYVLIDRVCGTTRKTTLKICGCYLGVLLLIGIGISLIPGA